MEPADPPWHILVDHGPDALIELDAAGRVRSANAAARAMLPDPVGRLLAEQVALSDADLAARLAAPPPAGLDREVLLATGRRALARAIPHPERAAGALVALRDVTERAQLRDEVEAVRRGAALGRLAGSVAHEINNPLTVLQLRSDLLLEEPGVPAALRQQLAVLRDSAARIARTVRTLQRLGRPELASVEWISLPELVATAVEESRRWVGAARVEVEPIPPVGVRGDPRALGLALEQVLAHAADPHGGRVRVTLAAGRARIEVHAVQARWGDGTVADAATTPGPWETGGSSVSLAVAAGVAQDHGGSVSTGRSGPGGWVRLELPLAGGPSLPTPRVRVLVLDDEPLGVAVIADWARRAGHDVAVARDPAEAQQILVADPTIRAILADDHLARASDLPAWVARARPDLAARLARVGGTDGDGPALPRPFTRIHLTTLLDRLLAR